MLFLLDNIDKTMIEMAKQPFENTDEKFLEDDSMYYYVKK